jgi:hypothetical protein
MELMETAFNDITTALIAISEEELGDKVNAFGINPPRYRFLDF